LPEIRLAERRDIPAIVGMGLRFLRETVYAGTITENPDQMGRLAGQLIDGDLDGVLYVAAEGDGKPIGMVGALRFDHPLSGESTVSELFWWCNPERRGSTGVRLLHALTQWAKDRGAVGLTMIAPTTDVEQIYERRGFQRLETSYLQRL
jgi:GNAT superfamily N-acetyltransferase